MNISSNLSLPYGLPRRLVPAGIGAAALLLAWWVFLIILHPLEREETDLRTQIGDLNTRIAAARDIIEMVKGREQSLASARAHLDQVHGPLPDGSPLAWFPNRIKEDFEGLGFRDVTARLNTARDEPSVRGYEHSYWAVDIPMESSTKDFRLLLAAVADFERNEPMCKVIDFAIRRDDDSRLLTAIVNVTAVDRK